MDDPSAVRVCERVCDRPGELADAIPGEHAAADDLGEAGSHDQLHDEERRLAILAVVVEADDVLVLERCENACLTREPTPQLHVLGYPGVQHFHCDIAPETAVIGAPDGAHAALADASTQLVAAGEKVVHTRENARFMAECGASRRGL